MRAFVRKKALGRNGRSGGQLNAQKRKGINQLPAKHAKYAKGETELIAGKGMKIQ
jgi:hypothetical protein